MSHTRPQSMTSILAADIAAGIRDGLSITDAAGFAWAMSPKATIGELRRAMGRARQMRPSKDTQSPFIFLSNLAGMALQRGYHDEQAAADLWSLRPELSARHISLVLASARQTQNRMEINDR